MSKELEGVKPGDELFVSGRFGHGPGRILKVDRVTPSGRIICGSCQFNPDGRLRSSDYYGRTWARLATDEDRKKVQRYRRIEALSRFKWETLTDEVLDAVVRAMPHPTEPGAPTP